MKPVLLWILATAAVLQCAAQTKNPLTDAFMARYKAIKANLIESAELMPEEHYGFKLTPAQRTFGEWIAHTAMANYSACGTIRGARPPEAGKPVESSGKAELVKALRDSFAFCDTALEGMTDQKAVAAVKMGERTVHPVEGMLGLLATDNGHYGNLVGYLRTKGLVPPSSARMERKRIPEEHPRPNRPQPPSTTPPAALK
jgi:hypothetical protein